MNKIIYIIMLLFQLNYLYSQTVIIETDSIFCNFDFNRFKENKDIVIPNYKFILPSVDLELKFIPNNNLDYYKGFENYRISPESKIKELTIYTKILQKHKSFIVLFNENGLITKKKELLIDIETDYFYDSLNNLTKKERICHNDSIYSTFYKYNVNNQLIEIQYKSFENGISKLSNKTVINYDIENRPICIYRILSDTLNDTITKILYFNNFVKTQKIYKGELTQTIEQVFSINSNLIRENTVNVNSFNLGNEYYCYNEKHQLCKTMRIKDDSIITYISTFNYDPYGNLIKQTFGVSSNPELIKSDIKYEYDESKNVIKEYKVTCDKPSSPYEIQKEYLIEYY